MEVIYCIYLEVFSHYPALKSKIPFGDVKVNPSVATSLSLLYAVPYDLLYDSEAIHIMPNYT
jgi:hypothetical protein